MEDLIQNQTICNDRLEIIRQERDRQNKDKHCNICDGTNKQVRNCSYEIKKKKINKNTEKSVIKHKKHHH